MGTAQQAATELAEQPAATAAATTSVEGEQVITGYGYYCGQARD
eukprot:COSAG01_NODE_4632_length_4861_cov_2.222596_6_plen_44_part_00